MSTARRPSSPRVAPNLVRWGAVFAGTVISLGLFALLSSLWLALAYSDVDAGGWVVTAGGEDAETSYRR